MSARRVAILVATAMAVSVVATAVAVGANEDQGRAIGPETTYSGCLLGGKITKVRVKDIDPERCETVVNPKNGKVARYVVWNASGVEGPEGPPGPKGATGPAGPAGEGAVIGWERVPGACVAMAAVIPNGSYAPLEASCPAGKKALGGGVVWSSNDTCSSYVVGQDLFMLYSGPHPTDDTRWIAGVKNQSDASVWAQVDVICATVP